MSRDHESSNTQDDYYAVLSDPSIDYASFTDDFVPPDEEYDEKEQDLIDDAWDFLNQYKLRYFLDDLLDQREDYLNSLNECAKNIKSNDSLLSNISKVMEQKSFHCSALNDLTSQDEVSYTNQEPPINQSLYANLSDAKNIGKTANSIPNTPFFQLEALGFDYDNTIALRYLTFLLDKNSPHGKGYVFLRYFLRKLFIDDFLESLIQYDNDDEDNYLFNFEPKLNILSDSSTQYRLEKIVKFALSDQKRKFFEEDFYCNFNVVPNYVAIKEGTTYTIDLAIFNDEFFIPIVLVVSDRDLKDHYGHYKCQSALFCMEEYHCKYPDGVVTPVFYLTKDGREPSADELRATYNANRLRKGKKVIEIFSDDYFKPVSFSNCLLPFLDNSHLAMDVCSYKKDIDTLAFLEQSEKHSEICSREYGAIQLYLALDELNQALDPTGNNDDLVNFNRGIADTIKSFKEAVESIISKKEQATQQKSINLEPTFDKLFTAMTSAGFKSIKRPNIEEEYPMLTEIKDSLLSNVNRFESALIIEDALKSAKKEILKKIFKCFENNFTGSGGILLNVNNSGVDLKPCSDCYDYKSYHELIDSYIDSNEAFESSITYAIEDLEGNIVKTKQGLPGINFEIPIDPNFYGEEMHLWLRLELDRNFYIGIVLTRTETDGSITEITNLEKYQQILAIYTNNNEVKNNGTNWVVKMPCKENIKYATQSDNLYPDFKDFNHAALDVIRDDSLIEDFVSFNCGRAKSIVLRCLINLF